MKKLLFLPFFIFGAVTFSLAQTASKQSADEISSADHVMGFKVTEFDFGHIKQGESVTHDFKFRNNGKEPLVITSAVGSCGCTVPEYPKEPMAPGAEGTVKVTFNSAGKSGQQDKTVTITYNTGQQMVLHMKGSVDIPTASPQNTSTAPTR